MNQQISLPKTVIWDLDGTLIDQTVPIVRCYREVVTSFGLPPPNENSILRSLGEPLADTMALFIKPEDLEEAIRRFRSRFRKIMFEGLVVLPGAFDLIEDLYCARVAQGILTNKHGQTARIIAQKVGFTTRIEVCVGSGDTQWHKPQVELTNHIFGLLGRTKEDAVVIGDSPTDIQMATAAGIKCYAVATGAHSESELLEVGATLVTKNITALQGTFEKNL